MIGARAVFCLCCLLAPGALASQGQTAARDSDGGHESASAPTAPPRVFEGYRLTLTQRYADLGLGTMYRFARGNDSFVDVFLFPYPESSKGRGAEGMADAVKGVAYDFVQSLPAMRQLGLVDDYRLAFSNADSVDVGNKQWQRGHFAGVAIKRRGQMFVSVFYAYGLTDDLLKVRADLPIPGWNRSDVPLWVRHLIVAMYANPEHRDELRGAPSVPAFVAGYSLYSTSAVRDSARVFYEYRATGRPSIRVSILPLDSITASAGASLADADRAAAVVKAHADRLAHGDVRGISGYRQAFAHPDTADPARRTIGYTAAGTFKCGSMTCADVSYAYVIGSLVVTTDVDMQQGATPPNVSAFTHSLVQALAH